MNIRQTLTISTLSMIAAPLFVAFAVYFILTKNYPIDWAYWVLAFLVIKTVVLGFFNLYYIDRTILKPVARLNESSKGLADNSPLPPNSAWNGRNEISELSQSIYSAASEMTPSRGMEKEEQLKRILDSAGCALIITDIFSSITDCNDTALRMFNFKTKSEITKMRLSTFTRSDYQDGLLEYFKVLQKSQYLGSREMYFKKKGDKVFLGEITATIEERPFQNTMVYCIIKDNTHREDFNQRIKEKSERLSFVLNKTGMQIWTLTDKNTYGDVNEHHARFLGINPVDLRGRDYKAVLPVDICMPIYDWIGAAFYSRKEGSLEEWVKNSAGEKRLLSIKWFPKYNKQGKAVEYVLCTAEDITDYDHTVKELKDFKTRYETLSASNQCVFIELNEEKEIIYSNDTFLRKVGKPGDEMGGSSFLNLIHKEDKNLVLERFKELSIPPYRVTVEHSLLTYLGWRCMKWEYAATRDESGKAKVILAMGTDITEGKQEEERLRKSLEERTTYLQEIHHRVKNNLQIISSLLNLQSNQTQTKAVIQALKISESRVRAMALLHESIYLSDNLKEVNMKAYIENLINKLYTSHKPPDLDLKVDLKLDQLYLKIEASVPVALIINELVSNSLEHAFKGRLMGEVLISISQKEDIVTVVVADNGSGLRDGFHWEHNSKLGLGLNLVKSLVNQMSGSVHIKNSSDGLKYTIDLQLLN